MESGLDCYRILDNDGSCNGKKKTAVFEIVSTNTTAIQCEENHRSSPTVYSKLAILLVEPSPAIQG